MSQSPQITLLRDPEPQVRCSVSNNDNLECRPVLAQQHPLMHDPEPQVGCSPSNNADKEQRQPHEHQIDLLGVKVHNVYFLFKRH